MRMPKGGTNCTGMLAMYVPPKKSWKRVSPALPNMLGLPWLRAAVVVDGIWVWAWGESL